MFARITRFDLVNGTSDIIRPFGDWPVASEHQEVAPVKVFRASQTTGIGVDELMRLMVQFGAPLRQLGYDFDQAASLMGKWERLRARIKKLEAGGPVDRTPSIAEALDAERVAIRDLVEARRSA